MRFSRILAIFALVMLIAGCSGRFLPNGSRGGDYPLVARAYDIETRWKTERKGDMLVVTGTMKVIRYMEIGRLELDARAMDAAGAVIGTAREFVFPDRLGQYDTAPFSLKLALKPGTKPARIRFYYTYEIHDDRFETGWGDFEEITGQ